MKNFLEFLNNTPHVMSNILNNHTMQPPRTMKNTNTTSNCRRSVKFLAMMALGALGMTGLETAQAQTLKTWTGGASGTLSNTAGWSGGTAPAQGDSWQFTNSAMTLTNSLPQNYTVNGILFSNVATVTSASLTNSTQFLTLTGGITNSQTTAGLVNLSSWNFIVNTNVVFTNTMNSASSQIRIGQLSGAGTVTYGANGGSARLILQPGAGNMNAFTGRIIATSGRVDIGATNGISSNTAYTFNNSAGVYLGGTNGETNLYFGVLDGTNTATLIQNSTGTNTKGMTVGGKNMNGDFAGGIATNNSSTISLTKVGSATQTLSGTNTYNGTTTISGGVLQLGNGGTRGSISNSTSITLNGGSLAVNRSDSVSQGGIFTGTALTGTGGFIQAGTGTTTLTAANTYSGTTEVRSGTLALSSSGTIANSTQIVVNGNLDLTAKASGFSLTSGQSLGGSGTVTTASAGLTAVSGSTLTPGNSPGNLTISSLILNGGANYNWQLTDATGVAGTGYDTITAGTLDLSALTTGNKFNVNLWTIASTSATNGNAQNFNGSTSYQWTLASYTSLVGSFSADLFNINTTATNGTGGFANTYAGTFGITNSGSALLLTYTGGTAPNSWTNGSGNLSSISVITTTNLSFAGPGGLVTNNSAATVLPGVAFTSDASGSYNVSGTAVSLGSNGVVNSSTGSQTLSLPVTFTNSASVNAASGNLTLSGTVDNGGNQLTVTGSSNVALSGNVSGAGALVKSGSGTATLSGSNSYAGGTALNAGTLAVSGNNALGSGDLTNSGNNTLAASAASTLGNNVVLSSGTLTVNDNGTTLTENGVLSGGGALAKAGAGTVSLSGNNSYSGTTTVNAGTLALNGSNSTTGATTVNSGATLRVGNANALGSSALTVNSGAALDLNGNNLTQASIAGAGKVTNGTGSSTLTLGDAGTTTFAGSLVSGSGSLALNKTGVGTVILSGVSTATGGATVNSGTLVLTNGSSFASTITSQAGTIVRAYGATLNGASIGGNNNASASSAGTVNFQATNSTLNGSVVIGGPASGTIAYAAPNMAAGSVGTNYGYAQFQNGVSATNVTVNGRLDIENGSYNLSGITGANNAQANYVGGGSGAIVYKSTTSNSLGFAGGGAFSGFYLSPNAVAALTQSGSGTTSFGIFGQGAGNTAATLPINSSVSFNGGNWAIGQFGQNNGFQFAAGTFTLNSNASITVGGNTGAGTTAYTHGYFNVNNGLLTFNGDTAEGGGGAASLTNTLGFTVGSSGTLTVNGRLQLGVNGSSGTVVTPSYLTLNGGVANITNGLVMGNANGLTSVNNDVINVTVNSGTLNVGSGGILAGYNSAAAVVVNETNTLTLNGGKILSAGAIGAPTVLNAGSSITSSFVWNGGQLTAITVNASNSQWNGVGSSITGNTLYNSNGTMAPGDIGTAGITTINGNYVQSGNGVLNIDVLGNGVATTFNSGRVTSSVDTNTGATNYTTNALAYDRLTVNGNNTLGGTLNVNMAGNIATNGLGSSYTIVSASTNTGTYGTVNLSGLTGLTNGVTGTANNGYGSYTTYLATNGFGYYAVISDTNTVKLSYLANTWQGGGNWGSGGASSWSAGINPSGSNFTAYFGTGTNLSVNLDQDVTVGGLIFTNGSGGYTVSSTNGSKLTLANATIANQYGNQTISSGLVYSGGLLVTNSRSSDTLTLAGSITGGDITVSGGRLGLTEGTVSNTITGTGGVTKSSSGSLTLTGNNSYAGDTRVTAGTLVVGSDTALGNGGIAVSGGSLDLGGRTLNNDTKQISLTGGSIDNGTISASSAFSGLTSGTVGAVLSGSAGLTVQSGKTLTLNAANTYTGQTTIDGGTLALGASGSLASSVVNLGQTQAGTLDATARGSSGLTLGAGQTLAGTGSVNLASGATLTVEGNLAPGNSPGVVNVNGNLALGSAATTTMQVAGFGNAGAVDGFDKINVLGDFTAGGSLVLSFASGITYNDSTSQGVYSIFNVSGIRSGNFSGVTLSGEINGVNVNGVSLQYYSANNTWQVWSSIVDGNGIPAYYAGVNLDTGILTVVPEPSTYILFGIGSLVAISVARSRRNEND